MFTKADGPIDWIGKNWGEIYSFIDMGTKIYDAVGGKDIPADAPPQAKKLAWSIRSFGDEIDFTRRMLLDGDLTEKEVGAITWFVKRHFIEEPKANHDTAVAYVIAWYRMNQWRLFLMSLDSVPTEIKKSEVEIPPTSGKGKPTKKTEFERVGGDEAKRFLKEIANIINADEPKSKHARYQRVLEHHKIRSIPSMPSKETLDWLGSHLSARGISERFGYDGEDLFGDAMAWIELYLEEGLHRGKQKAVVTATAHAGRMAQYAQDRQTKDADINWLRKLVRRVFL
jgi:hypothetical protein